MKRADPTVLEMMLRDLWRDVLAVDAVAGDDDFFSLGGDSYQAVAMLDAVEARTGTRLPASVLLQHPTPASLARRLASRTTAREGGHVVTLGESGDRTPIFAVHGSGDILFYAPLAAALGDDRPFYALQALPGDDGTPPGSIEDVAARYVAELKRVRPAGPYVLAGFCIGSTIAFAMARELHLGGDVVEAVIFIDTAPRMPPGVWERLQSIGRRLGYVASRAAWHARHRTLPVTLARWLGREPVGGAAAVVKPAARLDLYTQLDRQYRGVPVDVPVIYVISSGFAARPGAGVHGRNARRIAGRRLRVIACDAGHNEQFREPAVRALAARLEEALSAGRAR